MNPDDLEALKVAFSLYDKNLDGRLSKAELQTMFSTDDFNMIDSFDTKGPLFVIDFKY